MPFMGIGRPQAAGASSPVILSAAKNPSPIVHPFQVPPRIPRRDGTLPSASPQRPPIPAVGAALIRQDEQPGLRSKQSPTGRYSRVRCLYPPAALRPGWICLRQIAFVPNAGTLTPCGVRASPTGDGPADCRRYRLRGRQGAVPTGNADGRVPSLHPAGAR